MFKNDIKGYFSCRKLLSVFTAIAFLFLFLVPTVSATSMTVVSPPLIRVVNGSAVDSINWSGYAVNGTDGSITVATASWNVPAVTCSSSGRSYAAVWVGIDGFQSSTVEQTGTDSDCNNGVASYYAWYEFYPKASVKISSISVNSGDTVAAVVMYSLSTGMFTVAIKDYNSGQAFKATAAVSGAQRSSAEWIVEAPEVCLLRCKLTSLSNFGTAGFGLGNTNINLTCGLMMNGVKGSIGSFPSANVWPITMVSQSNPSVVKSQPSDLTNSGTSFTVTWESAGP
ncbi:MAG: hypothetical protein JRN52_00805 [Nitrososphaerota archaeon]|nr:hypothetical protein [Nitrososphaerota archaeon]